MLKTKVKYRVECKYIDRLGWDKVFTTLSPKEATAYVNTWNTHPADKVECYRVTRITRTKLVEENWAPEAPTPSNHPFPTYK